MAKKNAIGLSAEERRFGRKRGPDPLRPKNKHKRASYKKYRGQGR